MSDKDKQQMLQNLATQMQLAQDTIKQVEEELKKLGVNKDDLPEPKKQDMVKPGSAESIGKIIEGQFDGQNMIGPDGKVYPVPANYASKSKLVEGDTLKLTIADDGSFIYKQIGPVERKKIIAKMALENGQYIAVVGDKHYRVLYASVTYFKAQPGDEVTIVVPAEGEVTWAAIEAVISAS
jgi:DNA-directed RNA polymerase subunit H (RpoH/RPB5)